MAIRARLIKDDLAEPWRIELAIDLMPCGSEQRRYEMVGKKILLIAAFLVSCEHPQAPENPPLSPSINKRFDFECRSSKDFVQHGKVIGTLSLKRTYDSNGKEDGFNFDLWLNNSMILRDVNPPMFVEFPSPKNDWQAIMNQGIHIWWENRLQTNKGQQSLELNNKESYLLPMAFISFNQTRYENAPKGYYIPELILKPGGHTLELMLHDGYKHLIDRDYHNAPYFYREMSSYEDSSLPFQDLGHYADKNGEITAYHVRRMPVKYLERPTTINNRIVISRLTFNINDITGVRHTYPGIIKPWLESTSDYTKCQRIPTD